MIKPPLLRQTIENESWKILGIYQKINPRKTFSKEKTKKTRIFDLGCQSNRISFNQTKKISTVSSLPLMGG